MNDFRSIEQNEARRPHQRVLLHTPCTKKVVSPVCVVYDTDSRRFLCMEHSDFFIRRQLHKKGEDSVRAVMAKTTRVSVLRASHAYTVAPYPNLRDN
jgi:hypothetical protein